MSIGIISYFCCQRYIIFYFYISIVVSYEAICRAAVQHGAEFDCLTQRNWLPERGVSSIILRNCRQGTGQPEVDGMCQQFLAEKD
ncbi:hypothetical protein D5274_09180 [bacterium 1XD42-94]|nr:hypothetical protein [bacterium 1XD42-76]NBK05313.1 hypothetical protein [bacterium 1XD42-94]